MKRLFNFRPIVAVLLSFVSGLCVFLTYAEAYYALSAIISLLPVICFFCYCILLRKLGCKLIVFALCCQLITVVGFFSVYLRFDSAFYNGQETVNVTGRYVGVAERGNFKNYYFDNCSFKFNGEEVSSANLTVTLELSEDTDAVELLRAEYGNVYDFSATVTAEKKYLSGGKLNRKAFEKNIYFSAVSDFTGVNKIEKKLFITEKIRFKVRETLFEGMGKDEASLTYAMLLGDTSEIDVGLLDNIRLSGVAHIFAVSGLHVGVVSAAVALLLKKLRVNKYVQCVISLAVAFCYCAVCDFSASSVRAFLMLACMFVLNLSGKKNDLLNTVSLSAFITLLIKPSELYSAGFLLSYGAVYGICLLLPSFKRIFGFLPGYVAESLGVSLAAQIGSLPASICFFGNVPLVAILLNFFILPVFSVLFIIDIVSVILGVVTSLSGTFLFIPDKVTSFFVSFMSDVDFSRLSLNGNITWLVFPLCMAGIILASDKCNLGYKTKAALFTLFFGASMLISQLTEYYGF